MFLRFICMGTFSVGDGECLDAPLQQERGTLFNFSSIAGMTLGAGQREGRIPRWRGQRQRGGAKMHSCNTLYLCVLSGSVDWFEMQQPGWPPAHLGGP